MLLAEDDVGLRLCGGVPFVSFRRTLLLALGAAPSALPLYYADVEMSELIPEELAFRPDASDLGSVWVKLTTPPPRESAHLLARRPSPVHATPRPTRRESRQFVASEDAHRRL